MPSEWIDELSERVRVLLPQFSPNALSSLYHGFATSTYKPTGAFAVALDAETGRRVLGHDVSHQSILNIVWASATLDLAPSDATWRNLERRIAQTLDEQPAKARPKAVAS